MLTAFNQSLWGDEGFSAILSLKPISDIISIITRDTSPPLWNLLEHLSFQFLGVNEGAVRGLSLTFYLLTGLFVYLLTRYLWNRKSALLATALTLLNPFFFVYAFEGRMYSIMALGVTASMYFFITHRWFGFVIATLWALYSHHFAIFPVLLLGLWFIYEWLRGNRQVARKMFFAFSAIGIGYLPWMIPLYHQTKMVSGGFWLGTPTLTDLRNLLYEYLAQGVRGPGHQIALYLVLVILALRRWPQKIKPTALVSVWFLGPILLTWLISQKMQSVFYNRYLLYTIPAGMILLGTNWRPKVRWLIILTLLFFALSDLHYFTHPTKLRFKELGQYVVSHRQTGDYFINWNSSAHHLWETKFYGFDSPIYIPEDKELPFFVGTALMEEGDVVHTIPATAERVGVTTSGPIEEVIIPGWQVSETFILGNLKFIWLIKK